MNVELIEGQELVSCPSCDKTRPASPGYYICGDCGAEFIVSED